MAQTEDFKTPYHARGMTASTDFRSEDCFCELAGATPSHFIHKIYLILQSLGGILLFST